ncbi:uncharacterized protein LOC142980526 [Anticarsia gemmatalis]|uniref:uncharacterized protein LOC142980526 n=1 Tax=Anticarsia gemmatalis TaxID=129554 RepID=UPI003F76F462
MYSKNLVPVLAVLFAAIFDVQGYYKYNDKVGGWLKLHQVAKTWDDAYKTCWSEGALLASPIDKAFRNELSMLYLNNVSFYTGISSTFYPGGQFISMEGIPLFQMPVDDDDEKASDTIGAQCVSMRVEGEDKIPYVKKVPCSTELPFTCFRKRDANHTTPCGTTDLGYVKSQVTGNCYKVYETEMIFEDAYAWCVADGGYLAVLNDVYEWEDVKTLMPTHCTYAFIGLQKWHGLGGWMSVRGDRLDQVFNDWKDYEHVNTENKCAVIRGKHLESHNCGQKSFFICEKVPYFTETETEETPEFKIY